MNRAESGVGLDVETPTWPKVETPVAQRVESWIRQRPWIALLLVAVPLCSVGLLITDAIAMEGIVADGARTMARTGEYSVPHLHGEIYSYKPPLAYWLALAGFWSLGETSVLALRLPFALCALLMSCAILGLLRPLIGTRASFSSALAALTGGLMLQKLHLAEFDLPLAAGVGIAVAAACRNLAADIPHNAIWLLGYLALSAAFLAKGLPALMFYAPGLLLAAAVSGRVRRLFQTGHLIGLTIFAILVGSWGLSAFHTAGWQAFAQPMAEAADKGLTWTFDSLAATLTKPVVAWALFLPWTFLLVAPPAKLRAAWAQLDAPSQRVARIAACFVATGVFSFMLVPATQTRYLLPLATPISVLCGIAAFSQPGPTRYKSSVPFVIAVALAAWLAQTMIIQPNRASSRSLRAVAETFSQHLEPSIQLWTGPVSKHFRHSSLFFYMARPVATFDAEPTAEGAQPKAGDLVVFFSDEHHDLMAATPFAYEILEQRTQRQFEMFLARVVRSPETATETSL